MSPTLLQRARDTLRAHVVQLDERRQALALIPKEQSTARHVAQDAVKQARMEARRALHAQRIAARSALVASTPESDKHNVLVEDLMHARLCLQLLRQRFGGHAKYQRGGPPTDLNAAREETCDVTSFVTPTISQECAQPVAEVDVTAQADDVTAVSLQECSVASDVNPKDITLANAPEDLLSTATDMFASHARLLSTQRKAMTDAATKTERQQAAQVYRSSHKAVRLTLDGTRKAARQAVKKNRSESHLRELIIARLMLQLLDAHTKTAPSCVDTNVADADNAGGETIADSAACFDDHIIDHTKTSCENFASQPVGDTVETTGSEPDAIRQLASADVANVSRDEVVEDDCIFASLKHAVSITMANAPCNLRTKAEIFFQEACQDLETAVNEAVDVESSEASKASRLEQKVHVRRVLLRS